MFVRLPYAFAVPALLLLSACAPSKDAAIVGVAAIAELAQAENIPPSEITVDRVTFQNPSRADIEATHRLPDSRLPHQEVFVCEAVKVDGRWKVRCAPRSLLSSGRS